MEKRKGPYVELRERCRKWADSVEYAHKKLMWRYPAAKINESWNIFDLSERVRAADQLGFDVKLIWNDSKENGGLEVWYVKRHDKRPFAIDY